MPTFRSIYVYLIVFLGLLAYILFFDKKIEGTQERETSATKLYGSLKSDDITGLELTNDHGTFVFQKSNGHWQIKSPISTVADDNVIHELIDAILQAQVQRSIPITGSPAETAANLKEWGLTPAAVRVLLHTPDKTYELTLGRKTAINDSLYTRSSQQSDAPVRIVNFTLKGTLEKTLSDFRSRNLFDFSPEKVTRISATTMSSGTIPAQTYEVLLKEKVWCLQKPIVARATDEGVNRTLQKILAVRALDFTTDNPSNLSPYGLTTPSATLTVTTHPKEKDEESLLQLGGPVPGRPEEIYAQRFGSNSVFTVAKSAFDDAFHSLPDVRDLHILPFTPSKVTGLRFSFLDKKGEVRSHDSLWSTVGPVPGPADIGKIIDLLTKLGNLQSTPLLKDTATNLSSYGLDEPQGKITLTSGEFDSPLELSIGKHENKLYYVRNSLEPFIYTLQEGDLDFLPKSNLDLRDTRAVNLPPETVKSIRILPQDRSGLLLTRRADKTWEVTDPPGRKTDMNKAQRFCELVSQLKAKTWLGPVQPSYHLDKPQLKIILQTETGSTTLLFGTLLPDTTRAAQVAGRDLAFAVTDGDYSILDTSTLLPKIPESGTSTNAPPAISTH